MVNKCTKNSSFRMYFKGPVAYNGKRCLVWPKKCFFFFSKKVRFLWIFMRRPRYRIFNQLSTKPSMLTAHYLPLPIPHSSHHHFHPPQYVHIRRKSPRQDYYVNFSLKLISFSARMGPREIRNILSLISDKLPR